MAMTRSWIGVPRQARAWTPFRFLPSACSAGSVGTWPSCRRELSSVFRARGRHLSSLGESGEAGRDHLFAGLKAARDYRACVVLLRQRHWPHGDGVALLEHIDECPARATLDGGGRHHDHLPQRIDQHANVDEPAPPKLKIVVGKLGSELHCAGGLVDLIVDDHHLALIEGTLAVRCQG